MSVHPDFKKSSGPSSALPEPHIAVGEAYLNDNGQRCMNVGVFATKGKDTSPNKGNIITINLGSHDALYRPSNLYSTKDLMIKLSPRPGTDAHLMEFYINDPHGKVRKFIDAHRKELAELAEINVDLCVCPQDPPCHDYRCTLPGGQCCQPF